MLSALQMRTQYSFKRMGKNAQEIVSSMDLSLSHTQYPFRIKETILNQYNSPGKFHLDRSALPDRKKININTSMLNTGAYKFNNIIFNCSNSFIFVFSRSQKKMQMVSNISFFAMFVMYFLTAIFGYLTFYGK